MTNTARNIDTTDLTQQAQQILRDNDCGGYTIPTKGLYPFQWKWDSCFCAMGFHTFDQGRAWQELESLFLGQWKNGMVPHIIFHEEHETYFPGPDVWGVSADLRQNKIRTSGITQPPVMAIAIRNLVENEDKSPQAIERAKTFIPKVLACHRWFHEERDPYKTGLVAIYHPWESGRDNNNEWDTGMARVDVSALPEYERQDTKLVDASERPTKKEYDIYLSLVHEMREADYDSRKLYDTISFKYADMCLNAVLLRANRDLLWLMELCDTGEEDQQTVKDWITLQEKGFQTLWNEKSGFYESVDLISNERTGMGTSASYLALFAEAATKEQAARLTQNLEHWLEKVNYLVPSHDPYDQNFDADRYWRGPVWAIVNYMIGQGLGFYGYEALSARVKNDTKALMQKNGFFEYFNPVTGKGCGGNHFSWTAAIWLAW